MAFIDINTIIVIFLVLVIVTNRLACNCNFPGGFRIIHCVCKERVEGTVDPVAVGSNHQFFRDIDRYFRFSGITAGIEYASDERCEREC